MKKYIEVEKNHSIYYLSFFTEFNSESKENLSWGVRQTNYPDGCTEYSYLRANNNVSPEEFARSREITNDEFIKKVQEYRNYRGIKL